MYLRIYWRTRIEYSSVYKNILENQEYSSASKDILENNVFCSISKNMLENLVYCSVSMVENLVHIALYLRIY